MSQRRFQVGDIVEVWVKRGSGRIPLGTHEIVGRRKAGRTFWVRRVRPGEAAFRATSKRLQLVTPVEERVALELMGDWS